LQNAELLTLWQCKLLICHPITLRAASSGVGSLLGIALGLACSTLTLHGVVAEQLASLLLDSCRSIRKVQTYSFKLKNNI
jgi:hypothetical protein